jgi:glycosyltransferase involved in cell wall biosynthesis
MISILHLVASSRGGGAVHVRDLATHLDRRRFAVSVAMPEDGGNVVGADFAGHAVDFHRLGIAATPSPLTLLRLRRLLRDERYELLHCHGARAAFWGRLAATSLGRGRPKVIYTIHGFTAPHRPFPKRAALLATERALSPVTTAVIAVSSAEQSAFLAAGLAAPHKIHVIHNGIDMARFRNTQLERSDQRAALGLPAHVPLITTVSRLYFPRDFETLLNAFDLVRQRLPEARLLIVGDGPYRPRVESLTRGLGLTSHVTIAGMRRDVARILGATDVFVLSTCLVEGLPLTILEAMASSLPVVASDVGGINEAVIHGETGLLVQAQDPVALSEAMLDLLVNTSKAKTLGERGHERAAARFTLERMVQETASVYETVMQ